nr:MAG TPA: hypothetical protein [Crassvirales sp.]
MLFNNVLHIILVELLSFIYHQNIYKKMHL